MWGRGKALWGGKGMEMGRQEKSYGVNNVPIVILLFPHIFTPLTIGEYLWGQVHVYGEALAKGERFWGRDTVPSRNADFSANVAQSKGKEKCGCCQVESVPSRNGVEA